MIVDAIGYMSNDDDQVGGAAGTNMLRLLTAVVLAVLAAYLSWQCNTQAGTSQVGKVLYALLASLFSHIYLLYYVVYRMLMGVTCGGAGYYASPSAYNYPGTVYA